ncbi:hypothetical protein [Streptomyces prasinus]|uniref:hypothetical protein n=1 Tax=Streptomyces prasinus TaxID=67345 RepID=UPI000A883760|nr:hypothetical protein [Streptomyces prasinus]
MKEVGALTVAALLATWLVWNLWNLFRIPVGLRNGTWRRPMWWTRLCSVSLFAGFTSWVWGASRESLDIRETCRLTHHEHYDEAYWESHAEDFQRVFPLHNKCNAHYDLVPAWVNPTIVLCAVVSLVAAAVLLRFGATRLIGLLRKENRS